ncbi:hypothetical protein GMMP15_1710002 [Candidatus Magnetomoraceae bacterium gMMP-15]
MITKLDDDVKRENEVNVITERVNEIPLLIGLIGLMIKIKLYKIIDKYI